MDKSLIRGTIGSQNSKISHWILNSCVYKCINESNQVLVLWKKGRAGQHLLMESLLPREPPVWLKRTLLSRSLIFLYCKHTEARRCLDAKEHQNNPRQTSKGLKHHLFHWWIWGLYPPPSSFYTHPMRSEEPANQKRLLLNFALVEFSIIKYGARGLGRICFHHCMNSNTSFSSIIYQEGIFQHIKFNFKKKNEPMQSNTHDQNPQRPSPAALSSHSHSHLGGGGGGWGGGGRHPLLG